MIDYILKHDDNMLYIVDNQELIIKDQTFQKYVNSFLIKRLTNLQALEKMTKKHFCFKSKIPLYIDRETLLLCIFSYRTQKSIYINYFSINKYHSVTDGVTISFLNGHEMKIPNYKGFLSQLKKAREILNTIEY